MRDNIVSIYNNTDSIIDYCEVIGILHRQ